MITFIDNVKDRTTRRCSQEDFRRLTTSEQTKQYIEQYRKTKQPDWKHRLPAVLFQGYHPACLRGGNGTRVAKDLVPTGFFLVDFDHLSEVKAPLNPPSRGKAKGEQTGLKPSQAYNLYLSALEKLGLKLTDVCVICHTTPSGDGLRIVQIGRKGSNVIEDQKWLSAAMGLECDKAVKDLSRLSFIPRADEIFYQNDGLLFGEPLTGIYPDRDNLFVAQGANPGVKNARGKSSPSGEASVIKETSPKGEDVTQTTDNPGINPCATNSSPLQGDSQQGEQQEFFPEDSQQELFPEEDTDPVSGKFPADYHGIPYTEIVDRFINYSGGTPHMGDRHARIVKLALDLRNICDNTVDWMMELIPNLGKTRSEKLNVVVWAVKAAPKGISKEFSLVLKELKAKYQSEAELPETEQEEAEEEEVKAERAEMPAMPERLPSLIALCTEKVMPHQRAAVAAMVFPPLMAHVSNAQFVAGDGSEFELAGMCTLVGKQSIGKGCVDKPINYIMADIAEEDRTAREREQAWAAAQRKKSANTEGEDRPKVAIRILESDTTPAAMLQRLHAAEHHGRVPNLCTFTKVDEIEELYGMCPTAGKAKITQLIRKTWDRGSIGAERFTASAANFRTTLRWNFTACGTIEKVKAFYASALSDGTLSRVDFCTIIPPKGRIKFQYGKYDREWQERLAVYIGRLREFECQKDEGGAVVPFAIPQLARLEEEMDEYIYDFSEKLEDDTWRDYAWRTKIIAMKKIITLYIAGGCRWEDEFDDFFRWSFHYSMWCKMNLFYEKATEAFAAETIIAERQVKSPLDFVGEEFTRGEFYEAVRKGKFKTKAADLLCKLRSRGAVVQLAKDRFTKQVGRSVGRS